MNIEVLLVQFLILAFTGVLWWIARRDLASRPAAIPASPPAETADLEQLCATLETLVTRLSRRLDFVERQLASEAGPEAVSLKPPDPVPEMARMQDPTHPQEQARMEKELARIAEGIARMEEGLAQQHVEKQGERQGEGQAGKLAELSRLPAEPGTVPDPRYAPVYALLDGGVTDPVEIARQTGLGRGEVELIISLRERRAF